MLRWLAGLEPNTQGHLTFGDKIWQDDKQFLASQQRQIGYVFQEPRLFPHLDVEGNLDYAWQRRFNANGPTKAQVCEWLGLEDLLNQPVQQLSGGQQQRVAIARALLSSPQLLLMDEPLASLDKPSRLSILNRLESLQQQLTIPILYVSHDLEEVSRLADQLLLLDKGQVQAQGPLIELCSRLDLSLNHSEEAASIIEARLARQDDDYRLSELQIADDLCLQVTRINAPLETNVRLRIPARDISLALEKPTSSSILNILPCTVDEIETTTDARVLIKLKLADQYLLARLTRKSVDYLHLQVGQAVYAQIKSVALLSEREIL